MRLKSKRSSYTPDNTVSQNFHADDPTSSCQLPLLPNSSEQMNDPTHRTDNVATSHRLPLLSNNPACSYQMNFPHASVHCLWAHEFGQIVHNRKVDIAQLSPPRHFFSGAHLGKDDEMNTASWTALAELLIKSRPRVVTLEQTVGLVLRARYRGYFNALIQVFTSHGSNIRWRLFHYAHYGLLQIRLRVFMIASWYSVILPLL